MRIPVKSTTARRRFALLIVGMLFAGTLTAQTVTLSVKATPIQKVCKEIEKQTGYYFVYPKDLQDKANLVTVEVKNAGIQETLEKVFKGVNVTWKIIDKVITVNTVAQKPEKPADVELYTDTVELSGRVLNSQGESMANASIMAMTTKQTAVTDGRGSFKLKGLRNDEELMVSYTGYKGQKLKASQRHNLIIVLQVSEDELDKVIVQAYGTTSRRLTTSNIGSLSSREIEKQPVTNILLALQSRVPGVEVVQQNGFASAPVKVEIRGRNSINPGFSSDPLYIIDGVPLTILDVGGTSTAVNQSGSSNYVSWGFDQTKMSSSAGQSPLFNINPSDIESMEVLKDADATAIYGSRGANGVILINTKKGKAGKTKLDLNVQQGVSYITRYWELLGTSDYLAMRREAFKNDNIVPTVTNAPDLLLWDTTRYTNWQKYAYGGTGKYTNIQTAISGGNIQTTYRLNAGYNRSTDISTVSGSNQKATLAFNLNSRSADQKFRWAFAANYSFANINTATAPTVGTQAPNAPAAFDSTGNINWAGWKGVANGAGSFSGLLTPYESKTKFLTGSLSLNYTIAKGLTVQTNFGYNNGDANQTRYTTIRSQDPSATTKPTGTAKFGNTRTSSWIVEPQIEYNGLIGAGKINVLVGGTVQSNVTNSLTVTGEGITNDALLKSISYATVITSVNRAGNYKYAGGFARLGYNWRNKYLFNLNGRRDGSSRFGPGKQFGNFGSIGAAWVLSEEDWLRKALPAAISFVKLRGSYGLTGSDGVGDYAYLSQWGNASPVVSAYNGISVLLPQLLENDNFQWQVNKKLEGAINLGFLQDQLNLEVAYYRNRCNNQLVNYPIPGYTGFKTVVANRPANVQNSGLEFQLDAKPINRKNFSWSVTYMLSLNRNKLISYPDFEHSPFYTRYRIGESLDNVYLLNYTGLDPLTGVRTYEDRNHDGQISIDASLPPGSPQSDQYIGINRAPKYYGSLVNNFMYKGLRLSFALAYKKRQATAVFGTPGGIGNIPVWSYENRWKHIGDVDAQYQRLTTNALNSDRLLASSNGNYTDASFIRLQNIALTYALPARMVKKAGMGSAVLSVNTQGIFVLTRYKGVDPEVTAGSMPTSRTITAGISCSF